MTPRTEEILHPHSPVVVDPTEVGPFDVCLRCFTPHNDHVNYCKGCGQIGPASLYRDPGKINNCINHVSAVTEDFCGLCAEPICKACQAHRTDPFSSPVPIYYCAKCLSDASVIEHDYFERLKVSGVCAKHGDHAARFHCKSCTLVLCPSCAYFHLRGIFMRQVGDGPFCLTCFRQSMFLKSRKRWISGARVTT